MQGVEKDEALKGGEMEFANLTAELGDDLMKYGDTVSGSFFNFLFKDIPEFLTNSQ